MFEDLSFYGSFVNKEPTEDDATVKAKTNPTKVIVQEPSTNKHFKSKYFYITLESMTGTKISITAQNPQDEESLRKKRILEKKKQDKQAGGKAPVIQKPGTLCAQ